MRRAAVTNLHSQACRVVVAQERLEAAIEGKHSKLTEVYKALESECQKELGDYKAGRKLAAAAAAPPEAAPRAEAAEEGCGSTLPHLAAMLLLGWRHGSDSS